MPLFLARESFAKSFCDTAPGLGRDYFSASPIATNLCRGASAAGNLIGVLCSLLDTQEGCTVDWQADFQHEPIRS